MIRFLIFLASLPVLLSLVPGSGPIESRTAASASLSHIRTTETEQLKARLEALQDRAALLNRELADTLAALEP